MKLIIQCVLFALLLSLSFSSFGHPQHGYGHGHDLWSNEMLHTIYHVSIFLLFSIGVFLLTKVITKKCNRSNKEYL
jgi:hypothetical protein